MSYATRVGMPWMAVDHPADTNGPCPSGFMQGLRLLAFLRVFSPIAQIATLFVVTHRFDVMVPLAHIVWLRAVELLIALATAVYVRRVRHVSALELLLQAHLDILLFAAMLYLTGGATNPFAPLFVLPMAVVATTLGARHVLITVVSTMAAYVFLHHHHVPMFHPEGETAVYELHEDGMVINYMCTAALLAVVCSHMRATMSRHERLLAAAREAQMRNESVLAIGALAAGYAHELSSPLSTMAVVVAELQREHGSPQALQQDLRLLGDQLEACKRIVSSLTSAGGRRRAESAGAVGLDKFIGSIIEQVHALHPGATVVCSLDAHTPAPQIVAEETLRQTITNLVTNGAQASPLAVHVSADWSGSELRIAVRDKGPGFSPEVLERVGQPLDSTRSAEGGFGLGLGLVLSVATLERLGGQLVLSNPPGGGALAEMHVPLRAILLNNPEPARHEQPAR